MASDPTSPPDVPATLPDTTPLATREGRGDGVDPSQLATLPRSTRYQVGDRLGLGGMGEVVSARDTHIGRDVAIKRIRSDQPGPGELARFLREAQIQGRLDHPSIVPIHDLALDEDGRPFFAMKQLAGVTLHEILAQRVPRESKILVWTPARLLRAFVDICLAIEFAHTRGVIHRDLKPTNLVLGDFGEAYVIDWGVARVVGQGTDTPVPRTPVPPSASDGWPVAPEATAAVTVGKSATLDGAVLGTPGYMAPEQLRAEPTIGPAADVYALGCILFEILAGEPLHPRGTPALTSTLTGIDARPSMRAPGRGISPELDAVCVRATAIEPADRFPSARALADAVQGYLDGDRDLELRRELARHALEEARTGLAAEDDEARRRATMRAAGRALALDPGSREAAELVAQLLLEPPRKVPPEVERELHRVDLDEVRSYSRINAIGYLGFLPFLPAFVVMGVTSWSYLAALYGTLIVNAVLWQIPSRVAEPPRWQPWVSVVVDGIMLGLCARIIGPWIVGPGLATVIVLILAPHPYLRGRTWIVWLILLAGTTVPWGLEALDLIDRTFTMGHGTITIWSQALHFDALAGQVTLLGYVVLLLSIATLLGRRSATRQREHQLRFALQAWQLRMLVPEMTSGAATATG